MNADLRRRITDLEALNKAKGELVVELTKRADALRAQLFDALERHPRDEYRQAIDAYDTFIKEC
jgi:hypothetical protein